MCTKLKISFAKTENRNREGEGGWRGGGVTFSFERLRGRVHVLHVGLRTTFSYMSPYMSGEQ